MAYLDKGLKLTSASSELQVIGSFMPVYGYRRVANWLRDNRNYFRGISTGWLDDNSSTWDWLTPLVGASTYEKLFNTIQAHNGARIFNRKTSDIPVNSAWMEFAIYDEEGREVREVSGEVYRPAIRITGFQGGATWSHGYVGQGQGGLASTNGFTTGGSSGYSSFWIGFLAEPNVIGSVNYFFAIAYQDSGRPEDYTGIDGYAILNIFQLHYSNGTYGYRLSYTDFNNYLYSANMGYYLTPSYIIPQADPDFQPEDETSSTGGYGGAGAHDHTSDTIWLPDDPSVSTASVGFFHTYLVSSGSLSTLGQYLFPTLENITDIESALRVMAGLFAYRDNCQYVVDLHAIPVTPSIGSSEYIKVGALSTDISVPVVSNDYVSFSCGSVSIPENFANFLDYAGTRCRLFLPFVGFVDIRPEYFQSGTLSVDYKFNVIDGSFMAFIRSSSSKSALSGSVVAQYGGSACIHFPVLAQSYGSLVSGLVAGSQAIVEGGGKTGNAGVAAVNAISAMQSTQLQPNFKQSNNYNASTSYLGVRTPYLIIDRVVPSYSAFYNQDEGIPANVTYPLGAVHGYTEIEKIDFVGDTFATRDDLEEIKQLLREGVIF